MTQTFEVEVLQLRKISVVAENFAEAQYAAIKTFKVENNGKNTQIISSMVLGEDGGTSYGITSYGITWYGWNMEFHERYVMG